MPPTTVAPTSIPVPTSAPAPTATPYSTDGTELPALYGLMLDSVNSVRGEHGLAPLALGSNAAAQNHAEASLAGGFNSHWNLDGLKPSMRYTLAGGYQHNQENIFRNACRGSCGLIMLEERIAEAMASWMSSAGHRKAILRPTHRKLNIGLAWSGGGLFDGDWTFNAVQQFEGDYIEFSSLPNIDDEGYLSLAGTLRNGAVLSEDSDLGIQDLLRPTDRTSNPGPVAAGPQCGFEPVRGKVSASTAGRPDL